MFFFFSDELSFSHQRHYVLLTGKDTTQLFSYFRDTVTQLLTRKSVPPHSTFDQLHKASKTNKYLHVNFTACKNMTTLCVENAIRLSYFIFCRVNYLAVIRCHCKFEDNWGTVVFASNFYA